MKNYLTDPLTEDEKSEIAGIIWMVVRNCRYKFFNQKENSLELIENLDMTYNDIYSFDFLKYLLQNLVGDYMDHLCPLTESEKTDIVNKLNTLMDDLSLYELKRALTFNEKLVFFFSFMENYKNKTIQFLLSVDRKTIYNRQQTIKAKIDFFKEVF